MIAEQKRRWIHRNTKTQKMCPMPNRYFITNVFIVFSSLVNINQIDLRHPKNSKSLTNLPNQDGEKQNIKKTTQPTMATSIVNAKTIEERKEKMKKKQHKYRP